MGLRGEMSEKTVVVGFGYKARRGKDTACKAIMERLGKLWGVKQYAFADELREEVNAAIFDRWVQDFPGDHFEPVAAMRHLCAWAGVSYDANAVPDAQYPYGKQRLLCQWWGTEYRRAQDHDYWVKALAARIRREAPAFAVISDLRFFNEFEFCDHRVRMDRPGFEVEDGSHHISERQLDALPASRWDAIISARTADEVKLEAVHHFWKIVTPYVSRPAIPA
jgi:hypothetical protein